MMHDADIRLVERDSALPGLRLLLDSDALLASLQNLPTLRDAVSVTLPYLRYKPGTSCAVSLNVTLGSGECRYYFAKALTPQRFQQSWLHPKRQALIATGDPNAPQALHEPAIILLHPAHDRTLRSLNILLDSGMRQAFFKELLPDVADPGSIDWHFLRYKPERRAVIALSYQGERLAVLRYAGPKEYGRMLQGASIGAALGHIPLIALHGTRRMLATGWIQGRSLDPVTNNTPQPAQMAAAGRVLAQIHSAPFSLPTTTANTENIQALWRVMNTLKVMYPPAVEEFHRLAARLAQDMITRREAPVLIHGDFSADQVVESNNDGRLRVIDWDRCTYGSPLTDLATFQARLELQVIGQLISRQQADSTLSAFLSGYASHREVEPQSLKRYCAWALLCLTNEPFRTRVPNWPAQIEAILVRVALFLEQADATPTPSSSRMLSQLMHSTNFVGSLRQALNLPPQSILQTCTLLRHKPGRRAIIQYQFTQTGTSLPLTLLGKYRNKGLNKNGFSCQQALWKQGFGDQDPVSVPEPLVALPAWNIWLQRKVTADNLTDCLQPAEPRLAYWGERVAGALSSFQQHPGLAQVITAKQWHISDELAVLHQCLQKVAVLYPRWEARLASLMQACEKLGMSLIAGKTTSVHRDFYPDQIMIGQTPPHRLILLDFDLCCLSSAALDAGNYLAHVRELALRNYGDETSLNQHELAFVREYLLRSPGVSFREIQGFTTLSLTRHIFLSTQFRERAHTTSPLFDICERALLPWINI